MVDLLLQKAGMSYYKTNVYYKSWRDSRYRYGRIRRPWAEHRK